jgi:YgiT-type zinc finger domain-containing protein
MNCVICRHGRTSLGQSTVTFERGNATVVFRGVPAQVCENCGEEYVSEAVASALLKTFEETLKAGIRVEVREYLAA